MFDCCRHAIQMVVRQEGAPPEIILAEDGVIQGCVLGMALHAITLLPLAELLKREVGLVVALLLLWCADDFAIVGLTKNNAVCFSLLCRHGPSIGCHPSPPKLLHVCTAEVEEECRRVLHGAGLEVTFTRGHRCIGGCIGSPWMED